MKFCEKCGSIMLPKQEKKGKVFACPRCNFKSKELENTKVTEKVNHGMPLEVIENEATAYPLVDAKCPKCGHDKALFWEIQTRASDEPATQFFKCEKCNHTWRNYD